MKTTQAKLEKELNARIKTLKLHETFLRREISELHKDVRACSRTTFSDPFGCDKSDMVLFDDGLGKIRQAARDYVQCRLESRKFYDTAIRKGRKADGLTHKRIAGIDFIFPNIPA